MNSQTSGRRVAVSGKIPGQKKGISSVGLQRFSVTVISSRLLLLACFLVVPFPPPPPPTPLPPSLENEVPSF